MTSDFIFLKENKESLEMNTIGFFSMNFVQNNKMKFYTFDYKN